MFAAKRTAMAMAMALVAAGAAAAANKDTKKMASVPEHPERAKIIAANAASVLTVKFILHVKSPKGPDRNIESEAPGLMIDPAGLVLCPNMQTGGFGGAARRLGAAGYSASASDIKVLIGDDTEGLPASLIARDSELDLAWLQIKNPAGTKFAAVSLATEVEPAVGDAMLILARAAKFLGRAPILIEASVVGTTDRPRGLLLLDGTEGNNGAPAFTKSGLLAGVTILQVPDDNDARTRSPAAALPGFILPTHDLAMATRRARDQAARGEAREKEEPKLAPDSAPAADPAPEMIADGGTR